jgi:hypothetical protein
MQKLFNFLMVGLTFVVLNVATVAAQAEINPAEINPLESNTPPEQQEEMSEVVNATDGGTMSAAADAGAEADRLAEAKKKAQESKCDYVKDPGSLACQNERK